MLATCRTFEIPKIEKNPPYKLAIFYVSNKQKCFSPNNVHNVEIVAL